MTAKDSGFSQAAKLDNREEVSEKAAHIIAKLNKIDPNKVMCMMGIVVHADGEIELVKDDTKVHVEGFVMGDDLDIAKMFSALVQIAKNGLLEAGITEDTTNEVKH